MPRFLPSASGRQITAAPVSAAPPTRPPEPMEQWSVEPQGPDWERLASALLRYRWLVVAVTLVGTAITGVATRFMHQPYLASATIWIDQSSVQRSGGGQAGQLLDSEAWLDLLRSYAVLDQVVRDLGLYLEARPADSAVVRGLTVTDDFRPGRYRLTRTNDGAGFVLSTAQGDVLERVKTGDSVGRALGLRWVPAPTALSPGATAAFNLASPRDAARQLGGAIETRIDRNGNFLHVDLQGVDPKSITAIVNAVARRYVQVAADLKRQKLTELNRILQQQADYASRNLHDAESAYAAFRVRTVTLPGERSGDVAAAGGGATAGGGSGPDPLSDRYFRAEVERSEAKRDRDLLNRALAQATDSGVAPEALEVVGAVQQDAELSRMLDSLRSKESSLRALRLRYADAYQPVQRLSADVARLRQDIIPEMVRRLVNVLDARQRALTQQTDQTASAMRSAPPRAIEEARLQRALTAAQQLSQGVQQRYEETRLAEASSVSDVRMLDAAVTPQQPVRNTAPRFLALGFVGSLGLALVGVVILDRADPRVRYPKQVSEGMGLTILGAVPHLTGVEARRPAAVTTAAVIEALRGIRLNLGYAVGPGPVVVTITSTGSGDGKSFVSANLGLSFAEAGKRTLIIDGDIRRGVLHRALGCSRRPGLVDLLLGDASREQVIQATQFPGLFLIPSGARRRDAPERLSSPAMVDLLAKVRAEFDVVLVDSPPLTAGIDPYALSALTGKVVVIMRTGVTRREVTGVKLQVFDRLPVQLLGAILNDVPWGAVYDSYSYYLPGYEASDEDHGEQALPSRIV